MRHFNKKYVEQNLFFTISDLFSLLQPIPILSAVDKTDVNIIEAIIDICWRGGGEGEGVVNPNTGFTGAHSCPGVMTALHLSTTLMKNKTKTLI